MQKLKKFLYLTFLTSSSSSWWVESSWLNFQSSWVASSWKCEQFNSILIRVQNVNSKLNSMISLNKIMMLLIAYIARYVEQILTITWWSMWTYLWWKIKFSWLMKFLSLWISLLIDFVSIMQVFILRSF